MQRHDKVHQQPSQSAPSRLKPARPRCIAFIRYLLVGATLLAPASMVTTIYCGLNCNATCEHRSVATLCLDLTAATCSEGEYPCVVVEGCRCATIIDPAVGCNSGACGTAPGQAHCLTTPGCDWGDTCRDLIDCHSLKDKNTCAVTNGRQCYWSEDCG